MKTKGFGAARDSKDLTRPLTYHNIRYELED